MFSGKPPRPTHRKFFCFKQWLMLQKFGRSETRLDLLKLLLLTFVRDEFAEDEEGFGFGSRNQSRVRWKRLESSSWIGIKRETFLTTRVFLFSLLLKRNSSIFTFCNNNSVWDFWTSFEQFFIFLGVAIPKKVSVFGDGPKNWKLFRRRKIGRGFEPLL